MNGPLAVGAWVRPRATSRWATSPWDLLNAAPAVCGGLAIGVFVVTAAFRLTYPYPLESTEQATIEQVRRLLTGQPLYLAPTLAHVPLIYGPVYYALSALLARMLGLSYAPLRLVSLLASLGTLSLVGYLVARETGRTAAGLAAAGLLAATAPISGVFDVAHVDALFLFWVMAAITFARLRVDIPALALSGVCVGLAALTKVPIGAAPIALALTLYLCITARLRALAFVAGCVATLALGLLVLRQQDGPWATWYLLNLPSTHVVNNHGDLLGRFWLADTLPRFTFALLIGPVFLLGAVALGRWRPLFFYPLVCLSLIATAWAARSNSGGAPNVLAPGHLGLALLFGLGVAGLLQLLADGAGARRFLKAYVLALCVVQFALLIYNPRLEVPYRSEQWAADRLSATLGGLNGPLFAPSLDAYVRGTDKGEQPFIGAALELTGSFGGPGTAEGEQWQRDFAAALRERRFAHVVLIEDCCGIRDALAQAGYVSAGPLFPPGDDYWAWTGGRTPGDIQVFVPPPN